MTSNVTIAYVSFISGAALAIRDAIGGGAKDSAIIADVLQMISFHRELALVTFNLIVIFKSP
jgi:membrane metallo-endopeptidase-like protein 1